MSFIRKIFKSKRERTQHTLFYLATNLSCLISTAPFAGPSKKQALKRCSSWMLLFVCIF